MCYDFVRTGVKLFLTATLLCGCGKSSSRPTAEQPKPKQEQVPWPDKPASSPFNDFILKLWKTPIGEAFYAYMMDPLPTEQLLEQLGVLSERLFREPRTSITRISILQLLSEDLYRKGQLSEEAEKRLQLLEGRVSLKRIQLSHEPTENLIYHAAIILVASLPYGSPAVRHTLWNVSAGILHRLSHLMGGKSAPTKIEGFKIIAPADLVRGYEITRTLSLFLNVFGVYSFSYLFLYEYFHYPSGELVEGKVAIYNYDKFLAEAQRF